MIKGLVTKYGGKNSTILNLIFLLTCLLGFAGFLHVQELFDVKLKHIKIQKRNLEILILKSKIDQYRQRHVVYISRTKSECSPVKYLEMHLQKYKLDISNDNESPIIGHVFKIMVIKYQKERDIFIFQN